MRLPAQGLDECDGRLDLLVLAQDLAALLCPLALGSLTQLRLFGLNALKLEEILGLPEHQAHHAVAVGTLLLKGQHRPYRLYGLLTTRHGLLALGPRLQGRAELGLKHVEHRAQLPAPHPPHRGDERRVVLQERPKAVHVNSLRCEEDRTSVKILSVQQGPPAGRPERAAAGLRATLARGVLLGAELVRSAMLQQEPQRCRVARGDGRADGGRPLGVHDVERQRALRIALQEELQGPCGPRLGRELVPDGARVGADLGHAGAGLEEPLQDRPRDRQLLRLARKGRAER
mmetsp:Transcript_23145/g.73277  ORF Transcript_23145/g.73277 Transcript_23145/m.73277 type:complete len:288 (+) Transcript_23145:46-909(+)